LWQGTWILNELRLGDFGGHSADTARNNSVAAQRRLVFGRIKIKQRSSPENPREVLKAEVGKPPTALFQFVADFSWEANQLSKFGSTTTRLILHGLASGCRTYD
jgi:hypothetical protein